MGETRGGESRTQRKRRAVAAHDLGAELVALDAAVLDGLGLPAPLRAAVDQARGIRSHEGRRRQLQYVAALVRALDNDQPLRARLAAWRASRQRVTDSLQQVKDWRDALIRGDDGALAEVLRAGPGMDRARLEALVRGARDERAAGRPPRDARALFRFIRDSLGVPDDA